MGAVVAALAVAASAHYPLFVEGIDSPDRAEPIEDVGRARAFYGRLEPEGVDYYRFEGGAGQEVAFELLVPKTDDLRDFRPEVLLAGPGLTDDCHGLVLEAEGCERIPASAAPASVYEGFTQTYYWSYAEPGEPSSTVTLPAGGSYLVAVRADDDSAGPYALGVGTEQDFGVADALGFPLQWVSVRLWYFS